MSKRSDWIDGVIDVAFLPLILVLVIALLVELKSIGNTDEEPMPLITEEVLNDIEWIRPPGYEGTQDE